MRQPRAITAAIVALTLAGFAVPLFAQGDAGIGSDTTPLEVNVTGDSPPGWMPSDQLADQAVDVVGRYFQALDAGDYPRAYALLTADNQADTPAARFREEGHKFNLAAGRLLRRRLITSTWSKDPPGAPHPGTYVAFDLAAQFTNVDRDCGSLLLYQPAAGGSFKVLRSENYYLDNRTAQQIELSKSHQALLDEWARISAGCAKFSWDTSPQPGITRP